MFDARTSFAESSMQSALLELDCPIAFAMYVLTATLPVTPPPPIDTSTSTATTSSIAAAAAAAVVDSC